jgi:hypothetical protein
VLSRPPELLREFRGPQDPASNLLPHVHLVISRLKQWLRWTRQGAVNQEHLDYYLDEFTFKFNHQNYAVRGKLFYDLVQQAVGVGPSTYNEIVRQKRGKPAADKRQLPVAT